MINPADYDQWYATERGKWIGEVEANLIRLALEPRRGDSLLDVGCGTGYFTRALAPSVQGPVVGVDIDQEGIDYARRRHPERPSYVVADARSLPYPDASFDLVMAITSLCFIADESAAVREMVRVAHRRIAVGLLNRRSLLWLRKGRNGGVGAYRGARWHSVPESRAMFFGLPVCNVRARTAIHLPGGGPAGRIFEQLAPSWLPTGSFILVTADKNSSP